MKGASQNRDENDFQDKFDQNAQFWEQLQLGRPPTSHFLMGNGGLCVSFLFRPLLGEMS